MSFMCALTVLLTVSQCILLLSRGAEAAYLGIFFTSFAFGSYWVLIPAVEAEWFGRLDFGKIHGLLVTIAGNVGVIGLYMGVAFYMESTLGPCRNPIHIEACFQFRCSVNL